MAAQVTAAARDNQAREGQRTTPGPGAHATSEAR
jgi:hypothetical protein